MPPAGSGRRVCAYIYASRAQRVLKHSTANLKVAGSNPTIVIGEIFWCWFQPNTVEPWTWQARRCAGTDLHVPAPHTHTHILGWCRVVGTMCVSGGCEGGSLRCYSVNLEEHHQMHFTYVMFQPGYHNDTNLTDSNVWVAVIRSCCEDFCGHSACVPPAFEDGFQPNGLASLPGLCQPHFWVIAQAHSQASTYSPDQLPMWGLL